MEPTRTTAFVTGTYSSQYDSYAGPGSHSGDGTGYQGYASPGSHSGEGAGYRDYYQPPSEQPASSSNWWDGEPPPAPYDHGNVTYGYQAVHGEDSSLPSADSDTSSDDYQSAVFTADEIALLETMTPSQQDEYLFSSSKELEGSGAGT